MVVTSEMRAERTIASHWVSVSRWPPGPRSGRCPASRRFMRAFPPWARWMADPPTAWVSGVHSPFGSEAVVALRPNSKERSTIVLAVEDFPPPISPKITPLGLEITPAEYRFQGSKAKGSPEYASVPMNAPGTPIPPSAMNGYSAARLREVFWWERSLVAMGFCIPTRRFSPDLGTSLVHRSYSFFAWIAYMRSSLDVYIQRSECHITVHQS